MAEEGFRLSRGTPRTARSAQLKHMAYLRSEPRPRASSGEFPLSTRFVFVDGAGAGLAHGLDEAAREARVLLLDVSLRLLLVPMDMHVGEHHELVLHVRALVQLFAFREHAVDQIRHAPLRVARPGHQDVPHRLFHFSDVPLPRRSGCSLGPLLGRWVHLLGVASGCVPGQQTSAPRPAAKKPALVLGLVMSDE